MPYNLGYDFPQDAKSEICFISMKPSRVTPFMILSIMVFIFDKPLQCNRNPYSLSHVMDRDYTKVQVQISILILRNI